MTSPTDPLVQAVEELKSSINSLRDELVRKDVYTVERAADKAEVESVRKDVAEVQESMRWMTRTLVASLLMPIASSAIIIYVVQAAGR